jgi:hypothetical protein
MEVVRTLELEEDFLHKSSLSRLFALLSARDQNEEWSGEKNKDRKNGVKEKGQNTSGSGFAAPQRSPSGRKKFSPIELQYHLKLKRKKKYIILSI